LNPGTVVTAARQIVATSEGGGRLCRQSRPLRWWLFLSNYTTQTVRFNQYTFMLSLDVVGPGDSLSTVLIATPYWRDASWRESWQAVTATVAHSCDWMAAAPLLQLGSGWRQRRWSGIGFQQRWTKNLLFCFVFVFGLYLISLLISSAFSYKKNRQFSSIL
jgi:hypothetical protein